MKVISLIFLWLAATVTCDFPSHGYDHHHVQFCNEIPPESILYHNPVSSSGTRRIRGMRDTRNADFVLGGLFPAHQNSQDGEEFCSIPAHISLVDAMLFALDNVNSDPKILTNVTVGFDIRDTCFLAQIGLDEAADLILSGTEYRKNLAEFDENKNNETTTQPLVIGLIGAASSSVSVPIASISQIFNIPQISYASQSSLLEKRDRFSYFYRTLPSNSIEVQVIVDLLKHFEWSHISILYSKDTYGQTGVNTLQTLVKKSDICIDLNESFDNNFSQEHYRKLIEKLLKSAANVIVLYAPENEALNFISELKNMNITKRFIWIGTTAWSHRANRIPPQMVSGIFSSLPLLNRYRPFYDYYYFHLFPNNNSRNPWFSDLFDVPFFKKAQRAANCSLHNCTKKKIVNPFNVLIPSDTYSATVIDAVYTYAYALDKYINDNCAKPLVWNKNTKTCLGQKTPFSGSGLLQYISDVNFSSLTGNKISFDSKGSINCPYNIINYQVNVHQNQTKYNFKNIGVWKNNSFTFDSSVPPQFNINYKDQRMYKPVISKCNQCLPGQYIRNINGSCCGFCDACLGQMFSNSSVAMECMNCSIWGNMWGDNPLIGSTGCVEIPVVYSEFRYPVAIVITIGSFVGLILLIITSVFFGIYWKSPVIKASSRESVVLIMIGAGCSFVSSLVYLGPPFLPICALQRILIWFCFSLMNSSLLIKMIRVTRIFIFEKRKMSPHRCAQPYQQVILTLILVAIQMLIVIGSNILEYPRVAQKLLQNNLNPNASPEILHVCQPEPTVGLILSTIYEAGLIITTVILGTMTFKNPANFNESKSVCVSAYILLSIWTMFFISYFFTKSIQNVQNVFIALTNLLGAYTILACVVGPRMLTVIFRKEGNSNRFSRCNKKQIKAEDKGVSNALPTTNAPPTVV